MPPVKTEEPNHWRSLGALAATEEFKAHLAKAHEAGEELTEVPEELSGVSRRRFLQLMGASATLASLAACRWEEEHILAYNARPEGTKPGQARHFATAMEIAGVAAPLLVTSFDGRPIKVEGHPEHPASRGGTSVFAQASMLGLCDPDRSQKVLKGQKESDWAAFFGAWEAVRTAQAQKRGAGLAVVAEASSSATFARLKERFLALYPEAKWVDHEATARENEVKGSEIAFKARFRSHYQLAAATRVVTLEADLFGGHPDAVRLIRDFAGKRDPELGENGMSRVYAFESMHSTTGAQADHRFQIRPSQAKHLLLVLEDLLGKLAGGEAAKVAASEVGGEEMKNILVKLAEDLHAHRNQSVICVGAALEPEVHALAHRINAALGAPGRTVTYTQEMVAPTSGSGLASVAQALNGGKVEALIVLGANPVYDAPGDVNFQDAMAKAGLVVHHGLYQDETGDLAGWHLPASHYLECWGDPRAADGSVLVQQPLIDPLYDTRSSIELLAGLLGDDGAKGADLVKATHEGAGNWKQAVHDGHLAGSAPAAQSPTPQNMNIAAPAGAAKLGGEAQGFELLFHADEKVFDGRFANNGWLQELPGFMNKLTWDNAVHMSVTDANRMGIETGDVVKLTNGTLSRPAVPVYVMPGQAVGTLSLPLGYGRTDAGVIAGSRKTSVEGIGTNAAKLRLANSPWLATGVTLAKTGATHELACTQEHDIGDAIGMQGRHERVPQHIRSASLAHYEANQDFAADIVHMPPNISSWEEHKYEGKKWGMAIDLNKCVGCNACIIACQSENNIPIVGKEQVLKGREMHWLRLDRYFLAKAKTEDGANHHDATDERVEAIKDANALQNPEMRSQPMACVQCELAPCEQVCPVAATVHDQEGLNAMVYNRCIGTRYCANNCPYKVRRFNYFNNQLHMQDSRNEVLKMAYNPEVTVRARGVMEKCTYCTQRIAAAKLEARVENRALVDGDVVSACQQSCPADAISFGDLNLESSRVARDHANPRSYAVLAQLNNKPRTVYLAKVRNPNTELEKLLS